MKQNQFIRNRKELLKDEIIKTFEYNGFEPTKELIDFELNYGGLIIPIGLENIEFGIIWGGGFPYNPEFGIIEFEESESDDYRYDIKCAKSLDPIEFTLDEKGRYYEDYKLKYNSFEELINELIKNKQ